MSLPPRSRIALGALLAIAVVVGAWQLLLAWVRFATGQGAINIILDSLPSLGID
jgi:hypothetical protein